MHYLTIEFKYMFLLVNHPYGSVVLLPAGHSAELSFEDNYHAPFELKGNDVHFASQGRRLWGNKARTGPNRQLLPHMTEVFGRRTTVLNGFLESPDIVPAKSNSFGLNARLVLDGGDWTALPAASPNAHNVWWTFFRPNGGRHVQVLTDVARHSRPMTEPITLRVFGPKAPGAPDSIELPKDRSYMIRVVNDHDVSSAHGKKAPKKKPVPAGGQDFKDYDLDEFNSLYDLLNVGLRPLGPIGRVPVPKGKSTEEPICGAGQGDPEDPPVDPHNPDPGPRATTTDLIAEWREARQMESLPKTSPRRRG